MNTVIFNFHLSDTALSKSIRACSGKYSHVSIFVRGYIYEAHIKNGVQKIKHEWYGADDIVNSIWIDASNEQVEHMINFLENQVGKRYDLLGILSFIWLFVKQKDGKWYCSELAMVALMKLLGIHSNEYNQKQSPGDFHLVLLMVKRLIENKKHLAI